MGLPQKPGRCIRHDYEYERCGVYTIFIADEPLAGRRLVKITEQRTKKDWAYFIKEIADIYENASKITLVMDNLNTHKPGSLYEVFAPNKANALWDRFECVHTPKLGSWLNMAEIELNVLARQCVNRRIARLSTVKREVDAWQNHRNNRCARINWQFTTNDARIKLRRLYPTLDT